LIFFCREENATATRVHNDTAERICCHDVRDEERCVRDMAVGDAEAAEYGWWSVVVSSGALDTDQIRSRRRRRQGRERRRWLALTLV